MFAYILDKPKSYDCKKCAATFVEERMLLYHDSTYHRENDQFKCKGVNCKATFSQGKF